MNTVLPAGIFADIDLVHLFNNRAFTTTETLTDGAFNVWRNSLPAPRESINDCMSCSLSFTVQHSGLRSDNVQTLGQTVRLPSIPRARGAHIHFLGASERASRGTVLMVDSSGRREIGTLVLPDLWEGMARGTAHLAYRSSSVHYPHHVQNRIGLTLWHHALYFAAPDLDHLILPRNPAMHIFAMAIEAVS